MTQAPLISVVVSCYNHAAYVATCIKSVMGQTYPNVELIVIDDGSKDESPDIIESLSKEYGFFFLKQSNIGLAATLNKAIKNYVKGDYVAFIASDDYWDENKLALQMEYLNQHPDVALCCGIANMVNAKGEITGKFGSDIQEADLTFDGIFKNNKIPALTVVVKKDVFDKVGNFNETIYIEDWDMWLRIADQYKLGFVNVPIAYYRIHGANVSGNFPKMIAGQLQIIDQWKNKPAYKSVYKAKALEGFVLLARGSKKYALAKLFWPASQSFYKVNFLKGCCKLLLPAKK